MNLTPSRAYGFVPRAADASERSVLETSETARTSVRHSGTQHGIAGALRSLLACALLGLTISSVQAQETSPSGASKPEAVKVAKAEKKAAKSDAAPAASQDAAPAPAQAAPAAQPAPATPAGPPPGSVIISGLVDIYYGVNVRAPRAAGGGPFTGTVTPSGEKIGIDNAGRSFDINDREPSFSLGELNLTRTPGKGLPIGLTATLTVGDTARLVHATEPGGTSSWQTIQQFYGTYTPHILGRDVAIDFGKFVTPIGLEVIESSSNDNYSRSFGFQYAIPLYHAGLRVGFPITSKLSFLGGVVNGWNNVADDNDAKSFFTQFTWKPSGTFTGVLSYMGGAEGTGAYGTAVPKNKGFLTTNLVEGQAIWQVNSKLKLAGVVDYANAAGNVSGTHLSGNWIAYAGYARYQFSAPFALAFRGEQFEDIPGVGGTGLRLGGGYGKLNSATVTFEYTSIRGHLVSRLEYRHDHANNPFFGSGGGRAVVDQDTWTLGEVYKF